MTNIATNAIANSIGVLRLIDPAHIVPIQLNTLIPVGTAIIIVRNREHRVGDRTESDREHVVAPHHPAHEGDHHAGEYHGRVSE